MYGRLLPVVDENIMTAVTASLSKIDFGGILGEPAEEQPESAGKN